MVAAQRHRPEGVNQRHHQVAVRPRHRQAVAAKHHHLAADDIMVAADGSAATLLDDGALQFECFVHDVEDLVHFLGEETSLARAEVVALYLQHQTHLPPETDYEFVARPYRVEYELNRLRRLLRKQRAGKGVSDSAIAEKARALDALTECSERSL